MKKLLLLIAFCTLIVNFSNTQHNNSNNFLKKVSSLIDTTGFPLQIGNKWYYDYTSRYNSSYMEYVIVKTIVDTLQDGSRVVKTHKLYEDSISF